MDGTRMSNTEKHNLSEEKLDSLSTNQKSFRNLSELSVSVAYTRKRVNHEWLDSHGFSPLKEVRKRIEGSYRVITQEWLDANGFSPLEDVIKRIEGHKNESKR